MTNSRILFGKILNGSESFANLKDELKTHILDFPDNQILTAMNNLHQKGEVIDLLTLVSSLKQKKLLEQIGGIEYIVRML